MRASDIPGIAQMSVEEKILLVEDLWDSIEAADSAAVPVPESHEQELDRRLARYESHPGAT